MTASSVHDVRAQTCVAPTTICAIIRDFRERCTLMRMICAVVIRRHWLTNPDLSFGNYVSATRLGQNLNPRFPNVTRDAILSGLNSGRSLGQTLQDLGLNDREAKEARKRAEQEIKAARKGN